MPLFQSASASQQQPGSSLRMPAQKRISIPASQRLTTITEGRNTDLDTPPPIPRRSSRRNSASPRQSRRWSGSSTEGTLRTAPPPYDWVSLSADGKEDESTPSQDEKLARLRRGVSDNVKRRGGWLRLALIIGLVLLVIIGLAVGLGVGLSRRKNNTSKKEEQSPSTPSDSNPPQKFPLGQYSLVTALKTIEAYCTANPVTWRCYPDTVFSPSTNSSSLASFNWVISNTSSIYATGSTAPTPDEGVPANLTVSTTDDPFDISFTDQPLTYISTSDNDTSARYTFSFSMSKVVIPLPALTTDNSAAECFYNQTTFTGNLYLSAPRNYPRSSLADSKSLGGYEQWPYAVEITQTAFGGTDVPNCYKTEDGNLGDRITSGLVPLASDAECLCDYRNY